MFKSVFFVVVVVLGALACALAAPFRTVGVQQCARWSRWFSARNQPSGDGRRAAKSDCAAPTWRHAPCAVLDKLVPLTLSRPTFDEASMTVRHTPLTKSIYSILLSLVVVASPANACPSSYSSKSATTALDRIIEFTPFPGATFRIRASSHVSGAMATFCDGERYIIVNEDFLEGIGYDTLRWTWPKLHVLAHEIGHHAAGHLEDDLHTHKSELEADRFAGHLLATMGATLDQALTAPKSMPESPSETHPSRKDRVSATRAGYREAKDEIRFVLIGDTLPDMQRHWNRGMRIDAIGYGPTVPGEKGRFHVVLSREKDASALQAYNISPGSVPRDWIRSKWAAGYFLQSLTHSRGGWLTIMESRAAYLPNAEQNWLSSGQFPENDIEEQWDRNHLITSLSRGRDRWAMVTTESQKGHSQKWFRNYEPERMKEIVQAHWDENYHITSVGWSSDDRLTFVMTQGRRTEAYRYSSYFPEEIISDFLGRGYRVSHLVYGFNSWVVVMTTRPPSLD